LIQKIINIISIRFNSRGIPLVLLRLVVWARNLVKNPKIFVDTTYIGEASSTPSSSLKTINSESLCLLFVVTEKDFRTLPTAISYARSSILSRRVIPVTLIVPEKSMSLVEVIMSEHSVAEVSILGENSIGDEKSRKLLSDSFATRYGWALQQLLKVIFVSKSSYENVLVCDADTLLINKRPWTNLENRHILFPSYEKNPSYYRFLETAFGFGGAPDFSFVSHHMLFSRDILNEAFDRFGITNFLDLTNLVVKFSEKNDTSPFSIDYEFYGQYLYKYHFERLTLLKWSNLPLPARAWDLYSRSNVFRLITQKFFNSISFHSWS